MTRRQGDEDRTDREPCPPMPARVTRMCALAGINRGGYYRACLDRPAAPERTELQDAVQRHALANRHYGYRRIAALLRRDGWEVNHKRVLRLMREDNLLALRKPAFKPATTHGRHSWRVWPNLAYALEPMAVNQLWVADITYVRLLGAFVYLAVVIDAFSRKVVGWCLEDHLEASLTLGALDMALRSRDLSGCGLIHHSDRGVQYACADYIARLTAAGITPSMSRAGCPYDNAVAESFMKTLKTEEVDGRAYRDINQARASIQGFLEEVYNRTRLHSALSYRSPDEFEIRALVGAAAQRHQPGIQQQLSP